MNKSLGRPKSKPSRELMAFRFRNEYAVLLRKISQRKNLSQVRVLEMALDRTCKEL